jgi:hypothetical protein
MAMAVNPERVIFEELLGRIGFDPLERDAFITTSGCTTMV